MVLEVLVGLKKKRELQLNSPIHQELPNEEKKEQTFYVDTEKCQLIQEGIGADYEDNVRGEANKKTKKRQLEQCTVSLPKKPRMETEKRPIHSIRFDKLDHEKIKDNVRQRCKMEGCASKSLQMCKKCKVHLCVSKKRDCFDKFHSFNAL